MNNFRSKFFDEHRNSSWTWRRLSRFDRNSLRCVSTSRRRRTRWKTSSKFSIRSKILVRRARRRSNRRSSSLHTAFDSIFFDVDKRFEFCFGSDFDSKEFSTKRHRNAFDRIRIGRTSIAKCSNDRRSRTQNFLSEIRFSSSKKLSHSRAFSTCWWRLSNDSRIDEKRFTCWSRRRIFRIFAWIRFVNVLDLIFFVVLLLNARTNETNCWRRRRRRRR